MTSGARPEVQIRHNREVHDAVATGYEVRHPEIFNPTEQERLALRLREALAAVSPASAAPRVLDFGAGTGNLTGHLLACGARVVASDVSPNILAALRAKHPGETRLELAELNGTDLAGFADASFDMVATYSVLHHVPDYLRAVRECCRVVRPGGVIYLDHEATPAVWQRPPPEAYRAYQDAMRRAYGRKPLEQVLHTARNLVSPAAWRRLLKRRLFGLEEEGDIHVTADDHIEWSAIEALLQPACEVVSRQDYLVCRERSAERPLHRRYEGLCADMRLLVMRKRPPA